VPDAVVISQMALAKIIGRSERSVRAALSIPRADNWIEIRQLGNAAAVNASSVNDRVAWIGKRNGIRYSLVSVALVVSEEENSPIATPGPSGCVAAHSRPASRRGAVAFWRGPSPLQRIFEGMEPNLPATRRTRDPETGEESDYPFGLKD
jgi:hypothetical protein